MAHNLNFNEQTGKHSFFSVNEKPWHNLGQIVTDYPNSREALIFAALDYQVVKRKLYTHDGEINKGMDFLIRDIEIPDYQATIRTDNNQVLGVVGKDYCPVTNSDLSRFVNAIIKTGEFQFKGYDEINEGKTESQYRSIPRKS